MLLLLVASGVIISLCMGLRQSLAIFLRPMTVELGISAATFGFSIALQNIVWGLSQPFVGALADRHGARPVLVVTAFVYAAGLVLMSFVKALPGALELAGFLAGIGTAGTGFGVLIGTVSRATPPEKRTQTVGVAAAAGSLGTMVLAPLGQWLINGFGWKSALLAFAAIAASIALVSLPIREPSEGKSIATRDQGLGEALREAMDHRGYLFMTAAFFACGFQLVFITTHIDVSADLRRAAWRSCKRARTDRALQRDRHLPLRPARCTIQPETSARADLPLAHTDHHRVPRRSDRHRRSSSRRPWAFCGSALPRSSPGSPAACSASRTSTRSTASCS